jgi:hypothetical protein
LAGCLFHQHLINIGRLSSPHGVVSAGTRRDGSTYMQVLYRLDGKQSSTSFEDLASAKKFQKLVDQFGPAKALAALGADPEFSATSVHDWIEHHINHLTRAAQIDAPRLPVLSQERHRRGAMPLKKSGCDDTPMCQSCAKMTPPSRCTASVTADQARTCALVNIPERRASRRRRG